MLLACNMLACWLLAMCVATVACGGGVERDAQDLAADLAAFSEFQPGLDQCFEVLPSAKLRVKFNYSIKECVTYIRRYAMLARVVEELEHVQFQFENEAFPIPTGQGPVVFLGRVENGNSPAATLPDGTIVLLRREFNPGYFCATTYSHFPIKVNWGAVIAHEIGGHAWFVRKLLQRNTFFWFFQMPIRKSELPAIIADSNHESLEAENWWWRAGKTGIQRMNHDQARGCYAPLGKP
jgi:hypothetical protein